MSRTALPLLLTAALSLSLLSPPASAQLPDPPSELGRFDQMVGTWEGRGTSRTEEGGAEIEWTAVSTVSKPMGGHVIQEDVHIDLGDYVPQPMILRTIYMWDAHRGRYHYYSLSNVAPAMHGDTFWTSEKRLVTTSSGISSEGQTATHSVVEFDDDGYRFTVWQSRAGDAFYRQVTGSFRKSDKRVPAIETTADSVLVPPPEEMAALRADCGRWRFEGGYRPAPGAEMVKVAGTEVVEPILGGHVLTGLVRGDPDPSWPATYEERFYLAWSVEDKAYLVISHNNFGMVAHNLAYSTGPSSRVYTGMTVEDGAPSAHRMVRTVGEGGKTAKVVVDRIAGTSPAHRMFEADYRRVEEKAEEKAE